MTQLERQQEGIEHLLLDLENAEVALRTERRKVSKLKAELDKALGEDPGAPEALKIFQLWRGACNKPKAKFLAHRKQAVIKALKHYGQERVEMAVIGAGLAAHTNPKTGERYDDLELICRNETYIERFERIAKRAMHTQLDTRRRQHPFVAGVMQATQYQGMEDRAMEHWLFPCPVCKAGDLSLPYLPMIVRWDGKAAWCRECWADWRQISEHVSTTSAAAAQNGTAALFTDQGEEASNV